MKLMKAALAANTPSISAAKKFNFSTEAFNVSKQQFSQELFTEMSKLKETVHEAQMELKESVHEAQKEIRMKLEDIGYLSTMSHRMLLDREIKKRLCFKGKSLEGKVKHFSKRIYGLLLKPSVTIVAVINYGDHYGRKIKDESLSILKKLMVENDRNKLDPSEEKN